MRGASKSNGSKRFEARDTNELPWDNYNKHPLVLREDNAMPHQKEAIQVGQVKLKKHGCFLLADDPGLGKTRMTLELISVLLQTEDKVLLVVPRSLDSTWVTQVKRHFKAPYPNMLMLDSKITDHQVDQAQIVIATVQMLMNCTDYVPEPSKNDIDAWYDHKTAKARSEKERNAIVKKIDDNHSDKEIKDQVKRWLKALKKQKLFKSAGLKKFNEVQWAVTVLDEGHKIRNKDTGGNKVMRDMGKKTIYRMSLTGTVFNNAGEELWAYLITLRPSGTDAEANEYINRKRNNKTPMQYALEGLWMSEEELKAKNDAEQEKPEAERLVYARIEIDFEAIPVPKSENVVFRKVWKTKVQPGFDTFAIYDNDIKRTKCCIVQLNPKYQVLGEDEEEQPGIHNEFVFVSKSGKTEGRTYNSFVAFGADFLGQPDVTAAACYNHFYVSPSVKIWSFYFKSVQNDQLRGLSKTDQEKRSKKIASIKKKISAGALSLPVETILRIIGIRRQKSEVNLKLAKKTINDVIVHMSDKQYRFYKAIEEIEGGQRNKYMETLRLLQVCAHPMITMYSAVNKKGEAVLNKQYNPKSYPAKSSTSKGLMYPENELTPKIVAVAKILEKIKSDDPTAKSLVLTHSVRLVNMVLMDYLQQTFGPNSVALFNGTLSNDKRKKEMERFKTDPSCTILLMVDSMAVGLDIPEATNVLLVEHQWNPANEQQSMDRVHRIGQTKDVSIYRFISTWPEKSPEMQNRKEDRFAQYGPMTMDEKVVNRLLTKREAIGQYDAEKYMGVLKTEVTTVERITSKTVKHETRTLPAVVDQDSDLEQMLQHDEEYVQQSDEDEDTDEPARKKLKMY
uniref:SNF2 family DNA-dependent ATPase n=1 Tax=Clandestinovirus TaxID=2831644 RepID=A0A8F8KUK5_9VIRU|nr:SNF2 family DNA-dependent ATPase [Clandestinovirus]